MSGSVNRATILGNVGRDPEVRTMGSSGDRVANLSIATSETWRDKTSGERKERTEWHKVSVMNPNLVDVVEKYVRKGSKLYIEGQIQTRKWTDQQGQERYSTEIVVGRFKGEITLLDGKQGGGEREERRDEGASGSSGGGFGSGRSYAQRREDSGGFGGGGRSPSSRANDLDDDVPF